MRHLSSDNAACPAALTQFQQQPLAAVICGLFGCLWDCLDWFLTVLVCEPPRLFVVHICSAGAPCDSPGQPNLQKDSKKGCQRLAQSAICFNGSWDECVSCMVVTIVIAPLHVIVLLSVALIKCQGSVYRGCANLLARAAGRPVLPGAEVPYVD